MALLGKWGCAGRRVHKTYSIAEARSREYVKIIVVVFSV
jgi:hypothetical protein